MGSVFEDLSPRKVFKTAVDPLDLFGSDAMKIMDPIGEIFGGGKGKGAIGDAVAAFAAQQQPAAEPKTLLTPTTMPSPTSGETRQAKRKSYADQLARKGRASTILTQDDGLGASG